MGTGLLLFMIGSWLFFFIIGLGFGRPSSKEKLLSPKKETPKLGPYRNSFDMIVEEYEKEIKVEKKTKTFSSC